MRVFISDLSGATMVVDIIIDTWILHPPLGVVSGYDIIDIINLFIYAQTAVHATNFFNRVVA